MSRNQKANLREGIIQTSLKLGAERGEEGLTMRSIASHLGVSATALYQHFDRKSKIIDEIRLYGLELLQSEVLEPAAEIEDPRERLFVALRNYVDFACNRRWLYSVIMGQEQLDWSRHSPKERTLLLRPLRTIQDWLFEGAARGCWRASVDVDMASFKIWLAMHGLCTMVLAGRLREDDPAFPWDTQQVFIEKFIRSMIGCMENDGVSALREHPRGFKPRVDVAHAISEGPR